VYWSLFSLFTRVCDVMVAGMGVIRCLTPHFATYLRKEYRCRRPARPNGTRRAIADGIFFRFFLFSCASCSDSKGMIIVWYASLNPCTTSLQRMVGFVATPRFKDRLEAGFERRPTDTNMSTAVSLGDVYLTTSVHRPIHLDYRDALEDTLVFHKFREA